MLHTSAASHWNNLALLSAPPVITWPFQYLYESGQKIFRYPLQSREDISLCSAISWLIYLVHRKKHADQRIHSLIKVKEKQTGTEVALGTGDQCLQVLTKERSIMLKQI